MPLSEQTRRKFPLYRQLHPWLARRAARPVVASWEAAGKPVPPPAAVKHQVLREHAQRHGTRILVETGTYRGDTLYALWTEFDRVYSIELDETLHREAVARFADVPSIEIIRGDSGVELARLMSRIDQPALFWLDGHFSAGVTARGDKDTPIYEELACILDRPDPGHVILIDDARCFGTEPSYPELAELIAFIRTRRPNAGIVVRDDSIRVTP